MRFTEQTIIKAEEGGTRGSRGGVFGHTSIYRQNHCLKMFCSKFSFSHSLFGKLWSHDSWDYKIRLSGRLQRGMSGTALMRRYSRIWINCAKRRAKRGAERWLFWAVRTPMGPCPSVSLLWVRRVRNLADPVFGMPFVQILRQFPEKHVLIAGPRQLRFWKHAITFPRRFLCSKWCFVAICRHWLRGGSSKIPISVWGQKTALSTAVCFRVLRWVYEG